MAQKMIPCRTLKNSPSINLPNKPFPRKFQNLLKDIERKLGAPHSQYIKNLQRYGLKEEDFTSLLDWLDQPIKSKTSPFKGEKRSKIIVPTKTELHTIRRRHKLKELKTTARTLESGLKGKLYELLMRKHPIFDNIIELSKRKVQKLNGEFRARQFEILFDKDSVQFVTEIRLNGSEITDGFFMAYSEDKTKILILNIFESKSLNYRDWYKPKRRKNGSRKLGQVENNLKRFRNRSGKISIEGIPNNKSKKVFEASDVYTMDSFEKDQPYTLFMPGGLNIRRVKILDELKKTKGAKPLPLLNGISQEVINELIEGLAKIAR